MDRDGNIKQCSELVEFSDVTSVISYNSVFDKNGDILLTVSKVISSGGIIKFSRATGKVMWSELPLDITSAEGLYVDHDNNIYFSGYDDNLLTKLNQEGGRIFTKSLGEDGTYSGVKIIKHPTGLILLGCPKQYQSGRVHWLL